MPVFSRAGSLTASRSSVHESVRPQQTANDKFQLHPAMDGKDGGAGQATSSSSSSKAGEGGTAAAEGAESRGQPQDTARDAEEPEDEGAIRGDQGAEDESAEVPDRKCLPHPGDPSEKEIEEHEAEGYFAAEFLVSFLFGHPELLRDLGEVRRPVRKSTSESGARDPG